MGLAPSGLWELREWVDLRHVYDRPEFDSKMRLRRPDQSDPPKTSLVGGEIASAQKYQNPAICMGIGNAKGDPFGFLKRPQSRVLQVAQLGNALEWAASKGTFVEIGLLRERSAPSLSTLERKLDSLWDSGAVGTHSDVRNPGQAPNPGNPTGPTEADLVALLCYTWRDVFIDDINHLTFTDLVEHPIDVVEDAQPYKLRQIRYPQKHRDYAKKLFPAMADAGIIRPCHDAEWIANTLFRPKPHNPDKFRVVHDYRPINSVTKRIQYPCHDADMDIDALSCFRPRYYSQFDAANGYWGVRMRPGDEKKTAFLAPHGTWCYQSMPQGLKCAMQTYARFGDIVFGHLPALSIIGEGNNDEIHKTEFPSILGYNPRTRDSMIIYVDDHCVAHETFEDHLSFLHSQYFPRVAFGPVALSADKTHVFRDSLETIGFQLSDGRIRPSTRHRDRFANWAKMWEQSPPKTWEEVATMIYVTPFLRKWIPGRADLVRCIKSAFFVEENKTTPTGKQSVTKVWVPREKPEWTELQQEALQKICQSIQNNVNCGADYGKQFHLATDASVTGTGAVLFQLGGPSEPGTVYDQKKHFDDLEILMFASFRLEDTETRYSVPEKEVLAIVKAISDCRWITDSSPFPTIVYTDHLSIIQTMNNKGEVHGKVSRWIEKLSEHDLEFHHKPNSDKIIGVADGMSRLSPNLQDSPARPEKDRADFDLEKYQQEKLSVSAVMPWGPGVSLAQSQSCLQSEEMMSWYGDVIEFLVGGLDAIQSFTRNRRRNTIRKSLRFRIFDSRLYYVENDESLAECIPKGRVEDVLTWAHDGHGHFARLTTEMNLRGRFWWPSRSSDVVGHCRRCWVCQRMGPRKNKAIPKSINVFEPMALVGMDFMGPVSPRGKSGETYILLAVDYFSRFLLAEAMSEASGSQVASTWLHRWSPVMGWPRQTYSDNGSHFKNEILERVMRHHGTRMTFGPVSHPSSTGLPERYVRLMKHQMTRWAVERLGSKLEEWPTYVGQFVNNINSRFVISLRMSPSQLFLGYQPFQHREPDDDDGVLVEEAVLAGGSEDDLVSWMAVNSFAERRDQWREDVCSERAERTAEPLSGVEEYRPGELVWERRDKSGGDKSKFASDWTGPLVILEKASDRTYWTRHLFEGGPRRKIHVDDLKRYTPVKTGGAPEIPSWEADLDGRGSTGHEQPGSWSHPLDLTNPEELKEGIARA
ncbi:hypothetical protein VTK73DRAFT_7258 [Phialemonium thermophilum]|uniref:Integrase catalytic domain-containing protein n=1 Tax=Phialemonium thermophilum TaxID=223376 RepID=A0ABR3XU81_9PEZI